MCKGDVLMIKFITLSFHFCKKCKTSKLHEYGMDLETKKHYRQCISCETLEEVKDERQQNHIAPHNTS